MIPFGSIKENPEGIEPIGILYGNFIKDEYTLTCRLRASSTRSAWRMRTQRLRRRVRFLVREFAPSCEASDAEATEQCFVPIAHSNGLLNGVGHRFLLCRDYSYSGYMRRVRFLVRVTKRKNHPIRVRIRWLLVSQSISKSKA